MEWIDILTFVSVLLNTAVSALSHREVTILKKKF